MFKNVKKVLKGLGKTALGVGATLSIAMVTYGAGNATIENTIAKASALTGGNVAMTKQIVQNTDGVQKYLMDYSKMVDNKVLGKTKTWADEYMQIKTDETKQMILDTYKSIKDNANGRTPISFDKFVEKNIDRMMKMEHSEIKDEIKSAKQIIDMNKIIKEIKDFEKDSAKPNRLSVLEKGIDNGTIKSYSDFQKVQENANKGISQAEVKDKYNDYLDSRVKNITKDNLETKVSVDIQQDNAKQMSL